MNEELRFSRGHILAFLALIFIAYVTFMGITYLTLGNFGYAGIGALACVVGRNGGGCRGAQFAARRGRGTSVARIAVAADIRNGVYQRQDGSSRDREETAPPDVLLMVLMALMLARGAQELP